MEIIFLSRRNLLALLNKLDRVAGGDVSTCTIVKTQGPEDEEYHQTMKSIAVMAIDDEEYYGKQKRPATRVLPVDEAILPEPSTGTIGIFDENETHR